MTLAEFRERYPEFSSATDALVSAVLAEAASVTPSDVWGTHTDRGVGLMTAHLLTLSPNGARGARLSGGPTTNTSYGDERDKLAAAVAQGHSRVL